MGFLRGRACGKDARLWVVASAVKGPDGVVYCSDVLDLVDGRRQISVFNPASVMFNSDLTCRDDEESGGKTGIVAVAKKSCSFLHSPDIRQCHTLTLDLAAACGSAAALA